MVLDLRHVEGLEWHERRVILHGWVVPKESPPHGMICSEWMRWHAYSLYWTRTRPIPQDFSLLTQEFVSELAVKLYKELSIKADILAPVLNPTLRSALATLGEAKNLTPSELVALNSVIGGASVQNEFDIEAFYAKEDEVDK